VVELRAERNDSGPIGELFFEVAEERRDPVQARGPGDGEVVSEIGDVTEQSLRVVDAADHAGLDGDRQERCFTLRLIRSVIASFRASPRRALQRGSRTTDRR
jgi:hypothetical protein